MRAVEEVDDGAGDADEEEEDEDDEDEPEEEDAAASAAAPAVVVVGLGAVGRAGGAVELGFCGRKRWVGAAVDGAVGGWLGRRVDPISHGGGVIIVYYFLWGLMLSVNEEKESREKKSTLEMESARAVAQTK